MGAPLFFMITGCAFVLIGRRLYSNPRRAYLAFFYTNPERPLLKAFVRASATLAIFVGGYATTLGFSRLLRLPVNIAVALAIVGALTAVWFLRPKVVEEPKGLIG